MPMATFGFSVGDFIAAINLVKELAQALQDSKGSSKEYLEIITELRNLENALIEVKGLHAKLVEGSNDHGLAHAVSECRNTIDTFVHDIRKYHGHLSIVGSGDLAKETLRKFQWRLCTAKQLASFRQKLAANVRTIQLLVAVAQTTSLSITESKIEEHSLAQRQTFSALWTIARAVGFLNSSVSVVKDTVARIFDVCSKTENSLTAIKALVLLQREEILKLRMVESNMPPQIEFPPQILLIDALSRPHNVLNECIRHKDGLIDYLKFLFREIGHYQIDAGLFALQDLNTGHDVDIKQFNPFHHRKIRMSMLFEASEPPSYYTTCPKCQNESQSSEGDTLLCSFCGFVRSRIADVTDHDSSMTATVTCEADPSELAPHADHQYGRKRRLTDDQTGGSGGPSKVARTSAASSNDVLHFGGYGKPTLSDWEKAKATITELYCDRNRSLRDVVQIMRERHNFPVSMKMIKWKLAQWKLRKNLKVNRDWSAAALLHAERKAAGKKRTTFDIFGSTATVPQLEKHRIARGLSEQDFLFEARAMGMSIPPYIRATTPEMVMRDATSSVHEEQQAHFAPSGTCGMDALPSYARAEDTGVVVGGIDIAPGSLPELAPLPDLTTHNKYWPRLDPTLPLPPRGGGMALHDPEPLRQFPAVLGEQPMQTDTDYQPQHQLPPESVQPGFQFLETVPDAWMTASTQRWPQFESTYGRYSFQPYDPRDEQDRRWQ